MIFRLLIDLSSPIQAKGRSHYSRSSALGDFFIDKEEGIRMRASEGRAAHEPRSVHMVNLGA